VSAPLWDSKTSTFAGLLTTADYINVIQYYWQYPDALAQVDQFRLNSLRGVQTLVFLYETEFNTRVVEIEKAIGVAPIETVFIHPSKPLYEACRKMIKSKARRIPIIADDDETKRAMVVSVLTQYRILKFVAVNVHETAMLRKTIKELRLGTYDNLQWAKMDTPVIDVIHMLVQSGISSVPILDVDGSKSTLYRIVNFTNGLDAVINVFEAVDVIALIKGGAYDDLNMCVGEALLKRSDVSTTIMFTYAA